MSPYNYCSYAEMYSFVYTKLTAAFLSAQHMYTAKQAPRLNTSPATPLYLLCQHVTEVSAPLDTSHGGEHIAMARKWLRSPILKCLRESREGFLVLCCMRVYCSAY